MSKASVIKGGSEGLPTFASMLSPLTSLSVRAEGEKTMGRTGRMQAEAAERGYQEGLERLRA